MSAAPDGEDREAAATARPDEGSHGMTSSSGSGGGHGGGEVYATAAWGRDLPGSEGEEDPAGDLKRIRHCPNANA